MLFAGVCRHILTIAGFSIPNRNHLEMANVYSHVEWLYPLHCRRKTNKQKQVNKLFTWNEIIWMATLVYIFIKVYRGTLFLFAEKSQVFHTQQNENILMKMQKFHRNI